MVADKLLKIVGRSTWTRLYSSRRLPSTINPFISSSALICRLVSLDTESGFMSASIQTLCSSRPGVERETELCCAQPSLMKYRRLIEFDLHPHACVNRCWVKKVVEGSSRWRFTDSGRVTIMLSEAFTPVFLTPTRHMQQPQLHTRRGDDLRSRPV